MPLSTDEKVNQTSDGLVNVLKGIFHPPPGLRPVHAKGILLSGTFTPSSTASTLSTAPHFNNSSTPVVARFSSSTGIPQLPDTDPNGNPRGFAIRFMLGEHKHTDIVAHSTPFFPMSTGEGTLEFFTALATGKAEEFLGKNPTALAFVQAPKPTPSEFGKETYWGVNAFKLVGKEGKGTFVRYRVTPEAGEEFLDDEALKGKGPNFLFEGVEKIVEKGPIGFKVMAQVAEEGDVTDNNTVHWPESRKLVELGTIKLEKVIEPTPAAEQKKIIFDPVPRVDGIEPSDDPLIDVRAAVYLISGRERRAAPAA